MNGSPLLENSSVTAHDRAPTLFSILVVLHSPCCDLALTRGDGWPTLFFICFLVLCLQKRYKGLLVRRTKERKCDCLAVWLRNLLMRQRCEAALILQGGMKLLRLSMGSGLYWVNAQLRRFRRRQLPTELALAAQLAFLAWESPKAG